MHPKLRILQGRVATEVNLKLYENTEVRYNNALFFIKLYTADEQNNNQRLVTNITS